MLVSCHWIVKQTYECVGKGEVLGNFGYGDFRGLVTGCRTLLFTGVAGLVTGLMAEPCPAVRPDRVSAMRLSLPPG